MEKDLIELVRKTGLPLFRCREALEEYGNFDDAYSYLRETYKNYHTIS